MEKNSLRELIKEEIKNHQVESCLVELQKFTLNPDEFLLLKCHGPFTESQYAQLHEAVRDAFGKRALVIGTNKDYNIDIVAGKFKDGTDS